MTETNTHLPDAERIDAYLAGGLSAEERGLLEAHLKDCETCSAFFVLAREADDRVRSLLLDARPAGGFENRLIQAVRKESGKRLRILPPIYRAAVAAAAVLVIGAVGYYGGNLVSPGGSFDRIKTAVNLGPVGEGLARRAPALESPSQVAAATPSSNAAGWEFSGGKNIAHGWPDFTSDSRSRFLSGDQKVQEEMYTIGGEVRRDAEPGTRRDNFSFNGGGFGGRGGGEQTGKAVTGMSALETTNSVLMPQEHKLPYTPQAAIAFKLNDLPGVSSEPQFAMGASINAAPSAPASPAAAEQVAGLTTPAAIQGDERTAPVPDSVKVIRNGTMEFEVDSFDSALAQITKIANESGGYVSTTDSQKLPNGKVKGTVALRVPPDRLDVLVLSLRALGDLKSQQITAQDVSKEYNDAEVGLTAAKAMEVRLLDLIKNGSGQIKDMLAVEKELEVWREKIEKAEGEIRYYNNLISMSTLTITLYERDIKAVAAITETETANAGVEVADVEKGRSDAIKAIDDAKGRVVESELKKFDAGQLTGLVVADVPPDLAGSVIDRLKQIGKVARLEIHRQQSAADGADPTTVTAPVHIDHKPTRLVISLYNVANVAARRTTNITLAASDVEVVYSALLSEAKGLGGRVVTSNLDRGDANQTSGAMTLEFSPDKMEAAQSAVNARGDVLKRAVVENPDTQNSTDSKQGLTIQLVSLASIQPRESVQQLMAASDVSAAYHAVLDNVNAAHAYVRNAQLNEQDRQNVNGVIEFDLPRAQSVAVEKTIAESGTMVSRNVSRSSDTQNTVDSKVQMRLMVMPADRLPPRETTTVDMQVVDAGKAASDAQAAAIGAGGRIVEANVSKDPSGRETAKVVVDVPLGKAGDLLAQFKSGRTVRSIDSSRDANAPVGALAHARINLSFSTSDAIVGSDRGLGATIRDGLGTSVAGLLWSVRLIVIGLCLVGPWVFMVWVGFRIRRGGKRRLTTGA